MNQLNNVSAYDLLDEGLLHASRLLYHTLLAHFCLKEQINITMNID